MAYERVTKFLMVSVVIVFATISTTINYDFALAAPAIKPNAAEGTLIVTNIIRANCPQGWAIRSDCPEAANTGMLTKILSNKGNVIDFPVGPCCGEGAATHAKYVLPIGKYMIRGEHKQQCISLILYGKPHTTYCYEHANIQGTPPFGTGRCSGLNACEAILTPSGAYVSTMMTIFKKCRWD